MHYWTGTKILAYDVKIASKLSLKFASGDTLTWRERQLLRRTVADVFRLVPFVVLVIIPFMELLIPVFMRVFPNMLPTPFQSEYNIENNVKRQLKVRMEWAKFMQDMADDMAKNAKKNATTEERRALAASFSEFMEKVRQGKYVSNKDIILYAPLFRDDFMLDDMQRQQLVALCRYMGLSTIGTDAVLRFIVRRQMQEIRIQDRMINKEGVDNLTLEELRSAVRSRGMKGSLNKVAMRKSLSEWIDLSLNKKIPISLMVFSRAFIINAPERPLQALEDTISSMSDDVLTEIREELTSSSTGRLEALKKAEELIKEEATQSDELKKLTKEDETVKEVALLVSSLSSDSPLQVEREELFDMVAELTELSKEQGSLSQSALTKRAGNLIERLLKDMVKAEKKIGAKLKLLDLDADGVISTEELRAAIEVGREKFSEQDFELVMRALDSNSDGKVDLSEVTKLYESLTFNAEEADEESSTELPDEILDDMVAKKEEEQNRLERRDIDSEKS
mgnify:CR=1 FL=1